MKMMVFYLGNTKYMLLKAFWVVMVHIILLKLLLFSLTFDSFSNRRFYFFYFCQLS